MGEQDGGTGMNLRDTSRAQIHTLEGLAGAVVLILAVTYAFNAFVVTPTSDVDPGTEMKEQMAEDILSVSHGEEGLEVRNILLNWNASQAQFEGSSGGAYYYEKEPPDPGNVTFSEEIENMMSNEGLSYNLDATFTAENGTETGSLTLVHNGDPGSSAVTASRTVYLFDDDNVTSADGRVTLEEVNNESDLVYPIPSRDDLASYNRVSIRKTVW